MILGPISLVDCLIFVIFLIPQLLYQVGLFPTLYIILKVLPFLLLKLPFQLIHERLFTRRPNRSPFVQNATLFQDLVIRCVRYAFANMPASIGRVFFSKWVAYPFFRFRLFRHGFLHCPIYYQEVVRYGVKGLWMVHDNKTEPDIIIYYCHGWPLTDSYWHHLLTEAGGGFSMGSSYFYMEFLMAWATRLKDKGFKNPAVFALEYTLVPDAQWPTQFNETKAGYNFLRESFGDGSASKICVSGDSAGATLILSMLLHPGTLDQEIQSKSSDRPGLAILLSPWTHLVSELNQNTASDYLDKDSLQLYAKQYAGQATKLDEVISPGLCVSRWKRASPNHGYRIIYGAEEVFAPGIEQTIGYIKNDGALVKVHKQNAGIHAWPVVNLFLGEKREARMAGLDIMTECVISSNMIPKS